MLKVMGRKLIRKVLEMIRKLAEPDAEDDDEDDDDEKKKDSTLTED